MGWGFRTGSCYHIVPVREFSDIYRIAVLAWTISLLMKPSDYIVKTKNIFILGLFLPVLGWIIISYISPQFIWENIHIHGIVEAIGD